MQRLMRRRESAGYRCIEGYRGFKDRENMGHRGLKCKRSHMPCDTWHAKPNESGMQRLMRRERVGDTVVRFPAPLVKTSELGNLTRREGGSTFLASLDALIGLAF